MKKNIYVFFILLLSVSASAQITSPAPYCDATFDDNQFVVDDHISSVQIGALNNVTNAQYAAPHYVFYNNLTAPVLKADSAYKLHLKFQVGGGCGFGAWIDFNHNNSFESSEKVSGTDGSAYLELGVARDSTVITIPHNAISGITRMRIRIVEDDLHHGLVGSLELACNPGVVADSIMDWGETEDYNVNIVSSVANGMETVAGNAFAMWPNPSADAVFIRSENEMKLVEVTDAMGRRYSSEIVSGKEAVLHVSALAPGMYAVMVEDGSGSRTVRQLVR